MPGACSQRILFEIVYFIFRWRVTRLEANPRHSYLHQFFPCPPYDSHLSLPLQNRKLKERQCKIDKLYSFTGTSTQDKGTAKGPFRPMKTPSPAECVWWRKERCTYRAEVINRVEFILFSLNAWSNSKRSPIFRSRSVCICRDTALIWSIIQREIISIEFRGASVQSQEELNADHSFCITRETNSGRNGFLHHADSVVFGCPEISKKRCIFFTNISVMFRIEKWSRRMREYRH